MKIQRKFTSFILVIAMIASMFTTFTMSVSASATTTVRPPSYSTNVTARNITVPATARASLTTPSVGGINVTQSGTQHASISNVTFQWFVTSNTALSTGAAIEAANVATLTSTVLATSNASATTLATNIPVGAYRAVCKISFVATGVTPAIDPVYTRIVNISVSVEVLGQATVTSATLTQVGAVAASGTSPAQPARVAANIALGDETLKGASLTNFTVMSYSVDNGAKWTNIRNNELGATSDDFATLLRRLLNRGMTLRISDRAIDRTTKRPALGGTTIIFPTVTARPKAERYVVSYAVGQLSATPTDVANNRWALVTRTAPTTALTGTALTNLQIGLLVDRERTPITNGWKDYASASNTSLRNVVTIEEAAGERNASWAYRTAPTFNSTNGRFTPASAAVRVRVLTETRAPRLRLRVDNKKGGGSLRYRAGTTIINGGAMTNYAEAGTLDLPAGQSVSLQIRLMATVRRPQSAVQELSGDMPAAPTAN